MSDYSKLTSSGNGDENRRGGRGRRVLRRRKNLGTIYGVLVGAVESEHLKPDDIIYSRGLRELLGEERIERMFDRASALGDDSGPTRSCGDLLGGHGLGLRKVGVGKFLCPKKLPVVDGNAVLEEAVYE